LLENTTDFTRLREDTGPPLGACASNVPSHRQPIGAAAAMASCCLPMLFQAVENGGGTGVPDVQLGPINIPGMRGMIDRTLALDSSLLHEVHMINFVTRPAIGAEQNAFLAAAFDAIGFRAIG
jgi:predicted acylesterase/phospholipase RssA